MTCLIPSEPWYQCNVRDARASDPRSDPPQDKAKAPPHHVCYMVNPRRRSTMNPTLPYQYRYCLFRVARRGIPQAPKALDIYVARKLNLPSISPTGRPILSSIGITTHHSTLLSPEVVDHQWVRRKDKSQGLRGVTESGPQAYSMLNSQSRYPTSVVVVAQLSLKFYTT